MNIEIISGSPRKDSATFRVALFLQNFFQQNTQHNIGIIDVREWDVPTFLQSAWQSPDKAPQALQPLALRMFAAEAFILVSPEYNGSYKIKIRFYVTNAGNSDESFLASHSSTLCYQVNALKNLFSYHNHFPIFPLYNCRW